MTEVDLSRHPTRLSVGIADSEIPAGVHDLLELYDARIVDVATAANGEPSITLDLVLDDRWHVAEARQMKNWGNSIVVTFPKEALDMAEFDLDTRVAIRARKDEILLTRDEYESDE
jgi:hypothetical protein